MPAAMLNDHHRETRRSAIVRLLRQAPVRKQAELARLLQREGHAVTQSSISRDLRELGALKASDRYVLPGDADTAGHTRDDFGALAQFVRDVRTAGPSLTVVKCTVGAAQSVAAAIDKSEWPEVVGTVSGDDTLFLATADGNAQVRLVERLNRIFRV